jgi:hypothetical protein
MGQKVILKKPLRLAYRPLQFVDMQQIIGAHVNFQALLT